MGGHEIGAVLAHADAVAIAPHREQEAVFLSLIHILSGEDRFENWVVEFEKEEVIDCPKFLPGSKLLDFSQTKRILDHERKLKLTHGLFYDDALICENTNSRQRCV